MYGQTKMAEKQKIKAARRTQRNRDLVAERAGRRWNRQQKLKAAKKLPEDIHGHLLLKGLARPVGSVRGQLLDAILSNAVQDRDGSWIFDGSIRDFAMGGLMDGKVREKRYLLMCMQAFVDAGILVRVYDRKGKPVVYRIQTP